MEVCVYQTRVQKHDIRVEESMVDTRYTHCVEYQIRLVHLKGKLNGPNTLYTSIFSTNSLHVKITNTNLKYSWFIWVSNQAS